MHWRMSSMRLHGSFRQIRNTCFLLSGCFLAQAAQGANAYRGGHLYDSWPRATLLVPAAELSFFAAQRDLLTELCIVSRLDVLAGGTALVARVEPAAGRRCARCWKWSEDPSPSATKPDLCARCASVLEGQ